MLSKAKHIYHTQRDPSFAEERSLTPSRCSTGDDIGKDFKQTLGKTYVPNE